MIVRTLRILLNGLYSLTTNIPCKFTCWLLISKAGWHPYLVSFFFCICVCWYYCLLFAFVLPSNFSDSVLSSFQACTKRKNASLEMKSNKFRKRSGYPRVQVVFQHLKIRSVIRENVCVEIEPASPAVLNECIAIASLTLMCLDY